MTKRFKIVAAIVGVLAIAAIAWAGTISQQPYGISTPYWYGYSSGSPASYYLAAPTLSANDTACGIAAAQTLTNKTLTSPTIDGDAYFSMGSAGDNSAIMLGGGTDAAPCTTSTANKNFLEFRGESTATTAGSDSRLLYGRLYLNGATTGGGDCIRAFTTVEKAIGTARGAHVSLNYGASGSTSGLATAATGTLHIPNTGTVTGNVAALQAEIYCDSGDDDDVTVPAEHGLLRLSVSGDAGNTGNIVNAIHLNVTPVDAGTDTDHMVTTGCAQAAMATATTAALRVRIGSTTYWIPLATAIEAD